MNSLTNYNIIETYMMRVGQGSYSAYCSWGLLFDSGIKGMSENIEVISVVDKFLEHTRMMIFQNDGDPWSIFLLRIG